MGFYYYALLTALITNTWIPTLGDETALVLPNLRRDTSYCSCAASFYKEENKFEESIGVTRLSAEASVTPSANTTSYYKCVVSFYKEENKLGESIDVTRLSAEASLNLSANATTNTSYCSGVASFYKEENKLGESIDVKGLSTEASVTLSASTTTNSSCVASFYKSHIYGKLVLVTDGECRIRRMLIGGNWNAIPLFISCTQTRKRCIIPFFQC